MKKLIIAITILGAITGCSCNGAKKVEAVKAVSKAEAVKKVEVENLKADTQPRKVTLTWDLKDDANIDKIEIWRRQSGTPNYAKWNEVPKSERSFSGEMRPLVFMDFSVKIVYKDGQTSNGIVLEKVLGKHKNVILDNYNGKEMQIYLPDSYMTSDKKYPVMYGFDGQNLFDRATSADGEWKVDETLEKLYKEGKTEEMIVVGLYNAGGDRSNEYIPYLNDMGKKFTEKMVKEIIPYIEGKYRVLPGRENRVAFGGSLGGLMALYMVRNYPDYFSVSGAFSTFDPWLFEEMAKAPKSDSFIWIDSGSLEYSGSNEHFYSYPQNSRNIVDGLIQKGYTYGKDLFYYEDKNGIHHEKSWEKRFDNVPIIFKGKKDGKVTDFIIDTYVILGFDKKTINIANPVAKFDNGMTYSLYNLAKYEISGNGKIDAKGVFELNGDKEAEITVKYGEIEKKIKVSEEELLKSRKSIKE